jgi:hypothetical protein
VTSAVGIACDVTHAKPWRATIVLNYCASLAMCVMHRKRGEVHVQTWKLDDIAGGVNNEELLHLQFYT